jgi:energy-coupling factor transport system ATP-binding protein
MSIIIKDLTHIYSPNTPFEKAALKGINLKIDSGEFVGIIGHTGSGKSTLIQMFNGLLKPSSGTVLIQGEDIHKEGIDKRRIKQKVGLVFQYPEYQLFEVSIYKDVAYGPKNLGLEGEILAERVEKALEAVGISKELYDKSPFELSGGQKRRVAIAGVLAMAPDILILDEPTAGLDPKGRDELFKQLKYMHESLGLTIVLISHSMEDIARYVQRLIVLSKGKIAYEGTPQAIFKHIQELENIGLAVPQIRYIIEALNTRGFNLSDDVLTVEVAADAINDYLKKRRISND